MAEVGLFVLHGEQQNFVDGNTVDPSFLKERESG